ncbi:MAG: lysine exporter LysO family protein [Clostridiales bacterium]|nr:lysine exporter LysO family protein [Clostridiales bacterium]
MSTTEQNKDNQPSSFEKIMEESVRLSKTADFEKAVNIRSFEIEITDIAKSHLINEDLKSNLLREINANLKTDEHGNTRNKPLAFVLFFILFSMCRRQNYGNFLTLAQQYDENFNEYEIMKHLLLMGILNKCTSQFALFNAIMEAERLIQLQNDKCDFTTNQGVINVYCSLVCKYFEYNLEERNDPERRAIIANALKWINKAIEIDKKEIGDSQKVYNKFFLIRGRLLILLGKYEKGEADILYAIEKIPASEDRASEINEYNQFLAKSDIIHAYDLNEKKVGDLEKIKVNNYKSIALMTTLLGFLLGAINIFTTVTDTFTLAMLMLCYFGLLMVLVGTILIGFTLNFRETKKRFYVYDILLILVGIAILAVSLIIILNKG